LADIDSFEAGCRHAATASVSGRAQTAASVNRPQRIPDQVNDTGWRQRWTNLVNDAEQSFIPALSKLQAVEVGLVVGSPGETRDLLTLTVLDAAGRVVAETSMPVLTENCDHVMFMIPDGGVSLETGQTYRLKLAGGTTFGWKCIVGGYQKGEATFNGVCY
jgi:hypothetical protein